MSPARARGVGSCYATGPAGPGPGGVSSLAMAGAPGDDASGAGPGRLAPPGQGGSPPTGFLAHPSSGRGGPIPRNGFPVGIRGPARPGGSPTGRGESTGGPREDPPGPPTREDAPARGNSSRRTGLPAASGRWGWGW